MTLVLYYHSLSSFCQKVLIALNEAAIAFEPRRVDLGDPVSRAALTALWPLAKIPVLQDTDRDQTFPETSIIIEYVMQAYRGPDPLIPAEPDLALQARLWDRVFDLHVNTPMAKIVTDRLRPPGRDDRYGVEEAEQTLRRAYDIVEAQLAGGTRAGGRLVGGTWAIGDRFSLADCAAAPALFYAETAVPFRRSHPRMAAYLDRLLQRPSVARTLDEARPFFRYYPLRERLPEAYRPSTDEDGGAS